MRPSKSIRPIKRSRWSIALILPNFFPECHSLACQKNLDNRARSTVGYVHRATSLHRVNRIKNPMDFYFNCYSEFSLQRLMVSDQPRTDAFAAAIKEIIKGEERVIDVGTGTGLLAMLAAKAGAKKVYALDQANIAQAARDAVEKNHLSEQVEVININATEFQSAEPADVIISEWLGHFAFAEAMFQDVVICRDKNLKEGGTMLPSGIELMIAPLSSPLLYEEEGPGFWKRDVHGIDYTHLEIEELKQALASKTFVLAEDLIAPGKSLLSLDLATATSSDPWQSGEVEFTIERDGILDGFVGWFIAQLSPLVRLDTGPDQPGTHWQQSYFPFPKIALKKGQTITLKYALSPHPVESRSLELKLAAGSKELTYTIG